MIESDYLKGNDKFLQKLRLIPTLKEFSAEDLKGFLHLSKVRKYQPRELILEEGFFDSWVYFLISGKVEVVKDGEVLSTLRRTGDIFGEMGVIDGSSRSASVYAANETVCLVIDASYIDRLSGHDRMAFCYVLYRVFSEILANRLRHTSEELIKAKEEIKRLQSVNLLGETSRR